jgi:hypothetical protein
MLLIAGLVPAGCVTEGERASTGECPAGESCSELTPEGLHFEGAAFATFLLDAPGGIKTTAAGGSQTISVLWPPEGDEPREPFTLSFTAAVDAPFELGEVAPPTVELRAAAEGTGRLRILDGSGDLFDRVSISAAPIARADFVPYDHAGDDAWVVYASDEPRLVARLYGDDDQRLVDEGISLAASAAGVEIAPLAWDTSALAGLPAGEIELTITSSAGDTFSQTITAVDEVDEIAFANPTGGLDEIAELSAGEAALLCFGGTRDGVVVAGISWTYETDGPLEAEAWRPDSRCVLVTGTDEGAATLTVSAAGHELVQAFDVTPAESAARLLDRVPVIEREALTPGDRAARY